FISSGINDTQVNTMYMNSPGHRANILGNYNFVATAWVVAPNGYAYNAEEFLNAPSLVPTWDLIGGSLTSAPAVSSWGTNRLDVFGRGQDMALYHSWSTDGGSTWTSWERLTGSLTSDPAAASSTSGRLDVFARGNDLALYQQTYDSAGWHGWVRLGGTLASSPAASSWSSGRLDVFAIGQDQATYHLVSSDGTTWQPWVRLAGPWTSAPAAASQTPHS